MLAGVDVGVQSVAPYARSAGAEAVERLRELARPLRGARVLHLNATPYGGGVAEILRSEVPLLRDLGLACDWRLIRGDEAFFRATKAMHNGLQGDPRPLSPRDRDVYLERSQAAAGDADGTYDLVVVHDPQPLALRALAGAGRARWVWRCHIDTSEPSPEVWGFLRPFTEGFDAAVFTMPTFVPPDLPVRRVEIVPPAIDPESPKNMEISRDTAARVIDWIGVEPDRPLMVQVSRFDPWKDPLGVIAVYRMVRDDVPGLQLALVGSMALDDPEAWDVYGAIMEASAGDEGIHLFTNLTGVGNVEVNAFQRLADVVVQKSIREGFGLVVSETLWKGTPVVAARAGGIPLQMPEGTGGYLVDTVDGCADAVRRLLADRAEAACLGARGREVVRERFLLTRLIADELVLYRSLLGVP